MLKSIKNSYLYFLMLLTFSLIFFLISSKNTNVFASSEIDPLEFFDSVQSSICTKNKLILSRTFCDVSTRLVSDCGSDRKKADISKRVVDTLIDDILCIEPWPSVQVDTLSIEQFDYPKMKDEVTLQTTNIIEQAISQLSSQTSTDRAYVITNIKKVVDSIVKDAITDLWPSKLTPSSK
ncbi:hypothetical protein [Candidatus Phytoplasma melaleucae]|uniref:Effector n=1 Tax=Candidatus Phytoplasma melaleucae TaxID=2982630 RepID=A0ABT9DF95_9MOLU|nr:hypothetical protein ['Melaleuca sp.' phytoplasma]MDO8167979.1 hypothetical protein ['Melaleuca sp.' phytoplasma]